MDKLKRNMAGWLRWLHIYLSMFSFAALLFFAVTGITLNHTNWIEGHQTVEQIKGTLNTKWVDPKSDRVDELRIVEQLRNEYHIRAPLSDFTFDGTECSISFKGPGYNADGFIDRASGELEMTVTKSGVIAVMNDLHKGRDTGSGWAWLIDISAVLMIIVSLSGFAMIFFLKKKRLSGLTISLIGAIITLMVYYLFV